MIATKSPTATHRQGATVLVADDDPTIRSNLGMLLKSEGYHVIEASDGLAAAEDDRQAAAVSSYVVDLKMPVLE